MKTRSVKSDKTINELAKKAIHSHISPTQIDIYFDQNQIETKSEQITFLKYCAENYQPYFQIYMRKELKKYVKKTKQSAEFIMWLAKTDINLINYDILIELYDEDLDLFRFFHDEFSKDKNISTAQILGILLGGMGKSKPSQLFEILLAKEHKYNLEIVAINSIWVTSKYQKIPKKIISLIIRHYALVVLTETLRS